MPIQGAGVPGEGVGSPSGHGPRGHRPSGERGDPSSEDFLAGKIFASLAGNASPLYR